MNIITKLSVDTIRSHRVRSLLICVAVILTSVLFMTVMSIVFSMAGGYQLTMQLAGGSDFHADLSMRYSNVPPDELLSRAEQSSDVSEAYIVSLLCNFSRGTGDSNSHRLYAIDSEKALTHFFVKVTEGGFPQNSGEILLNAADFPDAEVGQNITVYGTWLTDTENGSALFSDKPLEYKVAGIFESEADKRAQFAAVTRYDGAKGREMNASSQLFVMFRSPTNITALTDTLKESMSDLETGGAELRANVNGAYLLNSGMLLTPANITLIVFAVAVVFFCALLLIYNIYSIALSQDIHAFGQLNVIGTTYKQLRTLTRRQTVFLYAISIIPGLALGYFIGWRLLMPVFMSLSGKVLPYRFNAWIPVISAVLTLFTLLFSALRPLRRLKRFTPVETLSGGISAIKIKARGGERSMNPLLLAISSATRNPKRMLITSLSAALSIILFIVISSMTDVMRIITTGEMLVNDVVLFPAIEKNTAAGEGEYIYYGSSDTDSISINSPLAVIEPSVYQSVNALAATEKVSAIRKTALSVNASETAMAQAAVNYAALPEEWTAADAFQPLKNAINGSIDALFIGVPDELCRYILMGREENNEPIYYDEYDGDGKLYNGGHIIAAPVGIYYTEDYWAANPDGLTYFSDGDTLSSDALKRDYSVMAADIYQMDILIKLCNHILVGYYTQLFVMPMSVYEAEFGTDTPILFMLCDSKGDDLDKKAADDYQKNIKAIISDSLSQRDKSADTELHGGEYSISICGRFTDLDELRERLSATQLTGYSLSAIIFLIGVINMVNSSLAGVLLRRREYAMLEAVGMTDGQLRVMMLSEGFTQGAVSAVISLLAGIPLTRLLLVSAVGIDIPVAWGTAVVMLCVLLAISAATSLWSYSTTKRAPVTERLRIDE